MDNLSSYEKLKYESPDFPILFHFDVRKRGKKPFTHWHESIEILAFTEGEAKVRIDDGEVAAAAGDIVVIGSNCIHNILSVTEVSKYYCLLVDRELCRDFGLDTEGQGTAERLRDRQITEAVTQIAKELEKPDGLYRQAVKLLSLGIILRLLREHRSEDKSVGGGNNLKMIKDAITHIRQNYRSSLSVDDVASAVGYSKYYFAREFKRIVRSTVGSYIADMRTEYACRLLERGDSSVSEIALLCGYSDSSYFIKAFRKRKGVTPGEYKDERLRQNPGLQANP